ncbi:hypothetical protein FKM82_030482 [Ascaphus truei]
MGIRSLVGSLGGQGDTVPSVSLPAAHTAATANEEEQLLKSACVQGNFTFKEVCAKRAVLCLKKPVLCW